MAPLSIDHILSRVYSLSVDLNSRSVHPDPMVSSPNLVVRQEQPTTTYSPGGGTVSPFDINNTFLFVLFGLVGAAFVVASIWFFFWAKNGGFRFRKGDWDEYKSTVLRRKGPNGTTLTGATPSTDLGGGSIVGSSGTATEYTDEKVDVEAAVEQSSKGKKKHRFRRHKNKHDDDVRAYRSERPARVGGLNREPDATYHDYSNTDMSEVSGARTDNYIPPKSGIRGGGGSRREPQGRQFSYTEGTEATFSVTSDDSHRPLTQSSPFSDHRRQPSRQDTPSKRASGTGQHHTTRHTIRMSGAAGSYAEPIDFESRYNGSHSGSEQARNTKTYHHPLPGLGKGTNGGFRRGGGGRRDSLSDSDGESRRY